jgi:7-alpha-hydroxysteroid dehydrogenase
MTSEAELTDRFLLTDQVAIITGAGKGIGAAIATTFAAAGADVVLTARTEADLESVAAEVRALGRRALVLPGNVNDLSELANIVDRTVAEFGRLDIVVNTAGGSVSKPYLETSVDQIEKSFHFNVSVP